MIQGLFPNCRLLILMLSVTTLCMGNKASGMPLLRLAGETSSETNDPNDPNCDKATRSTAIACMYSMAARALRDYGDRRGRDTEPVIALLSEASAAWVGLWSLDRSIVARIDAELAVSGSRAGEPWTRPAKRR